jgi:hypothetical protein
MHASCHDPIAEGADRGQLGERNRQCRGIERSTIRAPMPMPFNDPG